mgnify:CR=1 FL=1
MLLQFFGAIFFGLKWLVKIVFKILNIILVIFLGLLIISGLINKNSKKKKTHAALLLIAVAAVIFLITLL